MLKYKPKRYPKSALAVELVLFGVLIILAVISALQIEYKIISQALVFAVVAGIIYIATRYMIYEYTYAVSEDVFEISRVAGKIPATLVRIDISKKDELVKISGKKELSDKGIERYENLCLNLSPRDRLYAYITEINGKKTALLIETDSLFALAITEQVNMKKLASEEENTEE